MTASGLLTSNQSSLSDVGRKNKLALRTVESEIKNAPYMPYEPRGCQLEIITDVTSFLNEERHVVIESGTGTGKTVTSLAASLAHSKAARKRIVYLVRTITQTDAVMKELRAISRIKSVSGIALTGRNKSCPLFRSMSGFEQIPSNVLSMMCEDRRTRSTRRQVGGCRFYDSLKAEIDGIERYCRENVPSSDELDRYCEKLGVCPYEAKKLLLKRVDVVAAPYVQILNPDIRENLMVNMDLAGDPKRLMIIVDEAHNFLDSARSEETFIIDGELVDNAVDECSVFRDPVVWEEVRMDQFLNFFKTCIRVAATEKLGLSESEHVFEDDYIEDRMMKRFGMSRTDLEAVVETLLDLGETRTERLIESGENRISHVEELALLMRAWFSSGSERFVRAIKTGKDGEYLSATCIDPEEISGFLNSVPCTLHMSGTLRPLNQYARVLGLGGNPKFRTYPSPFPPENKRVLYVRGLTTRQADMKADPSMQNRLESMIATICNAAKVNTMVMFTSYRFMEMMRPYLERNIRRPLYWEKNSDQRTTANSLARFKTERGGVFFSVIGGSVTEGIDYPGDELCMTILVGVPYPPPSNELKAMSDLYDERYGRGKGWLYTSQVPAVRKINQATGRLIRTETDRGIAVILDYRVSKFAKDVGAIPTDDPVGEVVRFFAGKNSLYHKFPTLMY